VTACTLDGIVYSQCHHWSDTHNVLHRPIDINALTKELGSSEDFDHIGINIFTVVSCLHRWYHIIKQLPLFVKTNGTWLSSSNSWPFVEDVFLRFGIGQEKPSRLDLAMY